MIAPYFADTNVLVYAYDLGEPVKRARARSLMADLGPRGDLSISTQVLKEFYSVTALIMIPAMSLTVTPRVRTADPTDRGL